MTGILRKRRAVEIVGEVKSDYHAMIFADETKQAHDTFFHLDEMVGLSPSHQIGLPAATASASEPTKSDERDWPA
ncbi:hypothetical protein B5K10_33335 [Rhizobium leguminosarum bv. trifolii]|uniref:Uncharacterized protein n=2 Tax=Rhizobium TaxID=379 RepID=A0A3E1AXJ9_RHILT|nr:hypothetical protein AOG23_31900 [Rhizobium acidisoli]QAS81242.1 hypothetical protein CO657_25490 [Rhizobium acidisoli]RFB81655.1 hypothetical protein B5K10_33335 [Rhizobium leguminosarum bv. trifolii]RFB83386.1 hypothetical protein B5K11_35020 [Rhizobium leguminosarum bv. trifolii]